jgi:hypothetical protein
MRNRLITVFLMAALVLFVSCRSKTPDVEQSEIFYPETKKVDQVDDYFGTQVADPYRWLEDDNTEDVKAWVEEQNRLSARGFPICTIIPNIHHPPEWGNTISFPKTTGFRTSR